MVAASGQQVHDLLGRVPAEVVVGVGSQIGYIVGVGMHGHHVGQFFF